VRDLDRLTGIAQSVDDLQRAAGIGRRNDLRFDFGDAFDLTRAQTL